MDYRVAPEVQKVAEDLIPEYHELLASRGPKIDYVMMRSTGSAETRMFQIKKVTGLNAFLAAEHRPERFFGEEQAPERVAILVGWFQWQTMSEAQQKGLIDHILHHLRYDYEKDGWRIEPPEYGEFPEVLERWGFWRPDKGFREFAEVVSEQLSLLPDEPEETAGDEENVQVSLTFGDKTVETDTDSMRRMSEGLASGELVAGPGEAGEKVDGETGEVLEEAGARSSS